MADRDGRGTTRAHSSGAVLSCAVVCVLVLSGVARAQLAGGSWPMVNHDTRRSGVSTSAGPITSNVKWNTELVRYVKGSSAVAPDGTIYLPVAKLVCGYAPSDGHQINCFQMTSIMRRNGPAVAADGTIYIGARDNRLWGINPDLTTFRCNYLVGNDGDVSTSPVIAPDGTVYFGASFGGVVHAVDADCNLKWKYVSGAGISNSSPALGADGTVYIGLGVGRLLALDDQGTQGVLKWDLPVGGLIRDASPAVGSDGVIYIGHRAGVTAVNPNGTIKWTFPIAYGVFSTPAILKSAVPGQDSRIYVGSVGVHRGTGAALYALSPADKSIIWLYETGGAIRTSPAVDSNGIIYLTAGSRVIALNPDGTLLWSYTTERPRDILSSPSIGAGGKLFVAGYRSLLGFAP